MKLEKLKSTVENIYKVNSFNLEEYQDKYYFQKKLQENFPVFTEQEIYKAVENSLINKEGLQKEDYIEVLTNELYSIYLTKKVEDDSGIG